MYVNLTTHIALSRHVLHWMAEAPAGIDACTASQVAERGGSDKRDGADPTHPVRATHSAWLCTVAGLVSTAMCLPSVEAATSAPDATGHILTAMVHPRRALIHRLRKGDLLHSKLIIESYFGGWRRKDTTPIKLRFTALGIILHYTPTDQEPESWQKWLECEI